MVINASSLSRYNRLRLLLTPCCHVPSWRNFGILSLRQCSSYASVRVQRFFRLLHLFKNLYNERTVTGLLQNWYLQWYRHYLRARLQKAFGAGGLLFAAAAFSFAENGINDDEMLDATEFSQLNAQTEADDSPHSELPLRKDAPSKPITDSACSRDYAWEQLVDKDHFRLFRRKLRNHAYLYEYKCLGAYNDISPTAFFIAQMDLEYRKQWDKLVISLDVIDSEETSGNEVVRWVTHFPYPMYPREYVYIRRACVDTEKKVFVLTSKAVDHPSCPPDDGKCVRVNMYYSCLVIKAHGAANENGFDYVLTYFDDPKAPFPQVAYNWMVNYGVIGFLEKVHAAALALTDKRRSTFDYQQSASTAAGHIAHWQRLLPDKQSYIF